ncbi:aldose 1-epimerase family protein [Thermobifida halotolerans]|uniref:Aldose 1-epimerase family protein n=1 Tax=Thermobifida halotolerans TaxID=483545 RepID=A0A399G5Q9_9ACTN|nr:aldose 1-epimerase family protein [Thermobifida halotolerans]UOE20198.1 aldose 1-epimerase family protein [Thermobifida halotolerans]
MTGGSHPTITLEAGKYRATVDSLGAALRTLSWGERDLVWGYPEGPPQLAQGQVLIPWPNRIDRGRYSFAGTEYRLEITEPELDNAIHGLTSSLPWRPSQTAADSVLFTLLFEGAPGYPFRLEFSVRYTLDPELGLITRIAARNAGDRPAPYGHGSHNYLSLGLPLDETTLLLPATGWLPADDRMLPAGPVRSVEGTEYDFRSPRRVGPTVLDTAFTGLRGDADGRSWTVLRAGEAAVALWADESYRWLQVFSADYPGPERRRHLAVEPMTCPPNAFATGTDLIVLAPGERTESSFGITSTPA